MRYRQRWRRCYRRDHGLQVSTHVRKRRLEDRRRFRMTVRMIGHAIFQIYESSLVVSLRRNRLSLLVLINDNCCTDRQEQRQDLRTNVERRRKKNEQKGSILFYEHNKLVHNSRRYINWNFTADTKIVQSTQHLFAANLTTEYFITVQNQFRRFTKEQRNTVAVERNKIPRTIKLNKLNRRRINERKERKEKNERNNTKIIFMIDPRDAP